MALSAESPTAKTLLTAGSAQALRAAAYAQMRRVLAGELDEPALALWLTGLHHDGVDPAELAGFADAMREAAVTLPLTAAERDRLVDTCGTGGDGRGTFNISTAVALVAAAAGATVAKHGNRRVTSACGSADVLEALGIPVNHTPAGAVHALRQHRFAFLLATHMHPAMARVAAVRRSLPFRTVFNLLGPMTNPAGARRQVIGVYAEQAVPLVAKALALLGDRHHAFVVHGHGGLDELALSGESQVAEVRGTEVQLHRWHPADAGLAASADPLTGSDAAGNARKLRSIFAGELGPARDVVLLNAAAVLLAAGLAADLRAGAQLAAQTIDSGAVTHLLTQLAAPAPAEP